MTNKTKEVTAVIFDMDDLMINSHPLHMKVFEEVLQRYGISLKSEINPLTPQEESSFFGRKVLDVFQFLIDKYDLEVDAQTLTDLFSQLLIPVFEREPIAPMPGLLTLLDALQKENYQLALASSAKLKKIEIVLQKLGIGQLFSALVSGGDEIQYGKPAPDTFLKAAEKLNVEPELCLVLEDATNGVQAAKAAAMFCIGVHNIFTYQRLGIRQDLSQADIEVESLKEVNLDIIRQL